MGVIDKIKQNEDSINRNMDTVNKTLNDLKDSQEEENKEMQIKIENMEELVNTLQRKLLNKIKMGQDFEDLKTLVDKETEIVEEAKLIMEQLSQKNVKSLANDYI